MIETRQVVQPLPGVADDEDPDSIAVSPGGELERVLQPMTREREGVPGNGEDQESLVVAAPGSPPTRWGHDQEDVDQPGCEQEVPKLMCDKSFRPAVCLHSPRGTGAQGGQGNSD